MGSVCKWTVSCFATYGGESILGKYTSEEQEKGGNIVNKHFIPVKITDKKWADKLVNGEVYMRALHEFGSWGNVTEKDTVLNNNYRGDFFAGVTATYRTADDSDFFRGFPTEVKAHMANCCLVDESDVQFFKIFSLYRRNRQTFPDEGESSQGRHSWKRSVGRLGRVWRR
jgi:hypothetical protein